MLARETICIENPRELTSEKLKSLLCLYAPLVSRSAVCLYQLLCLDDGQPKTVGDLLEVSLLNIEQFERDLKKLNEYRLVTTWQKEDSYLLVLESPLTRSDFLRHEIYGRLLAREIGGDAFRRRCSEVRFPASHSAYQDVSARLDLSPLSSWNKALEAQYKPAKEDTFAIDSLFDIRRFLREASPILFPLSQRTPENLKAIASCADTFGISQDRMRILLERSYKENGELDLAKLKRLCMNAQPQAEASAPGDYNVPCLRFLMNKQPGSEITPFDKKILDSLVNEYHLPPAVVNVLVEHALEVCDNRLYKNYVDPVAADLNRNGIKDPLKAKEYLNKEKKETPRPAAYKDVLPTYEPGKASQPTQEEIDDFYKRWKK